MAIALFSIIIVNSNVMVFVMYTFFFKVFNTPALFTCFTQCLFACVSVWNQYDAIF